MRIGFDAKRLFFNHTGLGNYSRTLVRDLQSVYPQHEYHLYSPSLPGRPVAAEFAASPDLHRHTPGGSIPALWRSTSIVRDLKRDGIDLYHGLSNELPLRIDKSGVRSIVTIHDLIFKVYPGTYSASERLIYDLKFRYACRHADRIVAISNCTRDDIVRFYDIDPAKIEVIFQACNPLFYTLRSEAENESVRRQYALPDNYLLSVGTVEARKNLKLVLQAYALLPEDRRLPLVVVGKGGRYRDEAIALAERKGLSGKITWLNNLQDNTQLQSIYQMARALLYPSLYEGFGLPVAEALFCKTPAITAQTSSLTDAGGPGALYVDPHSASDMAAAIVRISGDEQLAAKLATEGYDYVHHHFTGATATAHMMSCYGRTLKG